MKIDIEETIQTNSIVYNSNIDRLDVENYNSIKELSEFFQDKDVINENSNYDKQKKKSL